MNKLKLCNLALLGLSTAFAADISLNRSDFVANEMFDYDFGAVTDCSVDSKENIYIYISRALVE
jgi:hypothetical protein